MSPDTRRPDLAGLERPALEAALASHGAERFRARQVFRWIHRQGATDVAGMTNLPKTLRAMLASG